MTNFASRVAQLTGVPAERLELLTGESLSQVLLIRWSDGRLSVAKSGPALATEAAMLRALSAAGVPAPMVEAEYDDVMVLEYVVNDGVFSPRAWADIGQQLRRLHDHRGESYGWPVDYPLGTVTLHNREAEDWPRFWAERRLLPTAALLDRSWRERLDRLAARLDELLPAHPTPSLLHGDLWTGNMLVESGRLVGLIDPACYHGDAEADLAMLDLFGTPPPEFSDAYGSLAPGWRERRLIYQLFPALAHVRLWGSGYHNMLDRLLAAVGV